MVDAGHDNVFLFYSNLIGYARIFLTLISCWYMPTSCSVAIICYLLSQLLDGVDGTVARYMGQGSRFGAMLDQLTDRCSTLCLLMTLSYFYPSWMFLFQLSGALDIASHWLHLHSYDLKGAKSHKTIEDSNNPLKQLLKYYYDDRRFLFFMCATDQLFYASLYVLYFVTGTLALYFWRLIFILCLPCSLAKSAISLFHLITAAQTVVEVDQAERAKAKSQ